MSTPKVSTRRIYRGGNSQLTSISSTSGGSRIGASASTNERPPIVLEWNFGVVVRVGYGEQSQPKHVLPLPPISSLETESQWYDYCLPIMNQIFYDLLMISNNSQVHRRFVCVTEPYYPRNWEIAMAHVLWNVGIKAYTVITYCDAISIAFGHRFNGLVVHVGLENDAHCIVSSDGHTLDFTYQVVPCGYRKVIDDETKIGGDGRSIIETTFNERMKYCWLDIRNPNSLMLAILKCLELCPIDVRKEAASNILVCGEACLIVPELPKNIAHDLKKNLDLNDDISAAAIKTTESPEEQKVEQGEIEKKKDNDDSTITTTSRMMESCTIVPINRKSLATLKNSIGLVSLPFNHRPDFIAWIGASIYSTLWYRHKDNHRSSSLSSSRIKWIYNPSELELGSGGNDSNYEQ